MEMIVKALQGFVGKTLPLKLKGADTGTINVKKCDVSGVEEITERTAGASVSRGPAAPTIASAVPSSARPPASGGASYAKYLLRLHGRS
jgi:hypothetical protein